MTEVSNGKKTTRCGMLVKPGEATAWESMVTCEQCGIKVVNNPAKSCTEPSKPDTVRATKSRHTDKRKKEEMPRATTLQLDKDLIEQVMQLRDQEEKKWDEIAEITGVASGKCMLAHAAGSLPKKELIKNATAEDIIRLRDDQQLSWGQISVRAQLPESTCRTMYTEHSGNTTKGLRIGKGGRHPGSAAAAPSGKKSGKATAKAAAPASDIFDGVEEADIPAMLAGYAIKVTDGAGNTTPMKVKSVKKVAKGKAILVDGDSGESRTIKLSAITAISKRKVL
jgi:hypothetical protein